MDESWGGGISWSIIYRLKTANVNEAASWATVFPFFKISISISVTVSTCCPFSVIKNNAPVALEATFSSSLLA